ncbi:MAG: hypothetical protein E7605_07750 [Ruminococcaceae bacterium]|nr:hypothetical protein [Oscillospiraceae bacterium]
MYTQRRTPSDTRGIPQNYSGNAFRYPPIGALGQEADIMATPPEPFTSQSTVERGNENYPVVLESGPTEPPRESGLLSMLGGHGIGNEELLLLGLCLLLSGEGGGLFGGMKGKGDVVPYLLLLLFLG